MSRKIKSSIGVIILTVGILVLGADRIVASADTGTYFQSTTTWTIVALILLLVGAIWLFKTVFD